MPRHPRPHPRPSSSLAAVLVLALVALLATASAGEPTAPPARSVPAQEPAAAISSELDLVPVDSGRYRAARQALDDTERALATATETRVSAEHRLGELAARDGALTAQLERDHATRMQLEVELAELRAARQAVAVELYVHGDNLAELALVLDPGRGLDELAAQLLLETVDDDHRRQQRHTTDRFDATVAAIEEATTEQAAVRADIAATDARRAQAGEDEARLDAQRGDRAADLQQARALAVVVGLDFPLVALDAYWRAAARLGSQRPACGIHWSAIAGIARVESRHGTYGGSQLRPDGTTTRPIIGIPLDGTNATRVVADSDGGELDGDPTIDRAVGPMQFIPTTWARWGRDGNGDGRADPHNLYDAALAAAAYLCAGGSMTDDAGMRQAFLRYNRSEAYADAVLAHAHRYAARSVV